MLWFGESRPNFAQLAWYSGGGDGIGLTTERVTDDPNFGLILTSGEVQKGIARTNGYFIAAQYVYDACPSQRCQSFNMKTWV